MFKFRMALRLEESRWIKPRFVSQIWSQQLVKRWRTQEESLGRKQSHPELGQNTKGKMRPWCWSIFWYNLSSQATWTKSLWTQATSGKELPLLMKFHSQNRTQHWRWNWAEIGVLPFHWSTNWATTDHTSGELKSAKLDQRTTSDSVCKSILTYDFECLLSHLIYTSCFIFL